MGMMDDDVGRRGWKRGSVICECELRRCCFGSWPFAGVSGCEGWWLSSFSLAVIAWSTDRDEWALLGAHRVQHIRKAFIA